MRKKKRSTIFGAALVIFGVLVGIFLGELLKTEEKWQNMPLLRWPQGGLERPHPTETMQGEILPVGPATPEKWNFSPGDAGKTAMQYAQDCSYRPDVKKLLLQPLEWDLTGEAPTVVILHTHATESYTQLPGQDYEQTVSYRTLDEQYNMLAVGDALATLLEQAGISVLHDRKFHDYPSYNQAYTNSRQSVQSYLQQYPSVKVVLDLHRDAVLNADGSQYTPVVSQGTERVAKLMLVIGTDGSGMYHPQWRDNLALALKLQVLLEEQLPGITRPVMLRAQRFNHDLSQGAMIVEVGAAGNTQAEALAAVPFLARALIALCHGATADSTS